MKKQRVRCRCTFGIDMSHLRSQRRCSAQVLSSFHVQLAKQKAVDKEIDCLVDVSILTKVDYSEWAARL